MRVPANLLPAPAVSGIDAHALSRDDDKLARLLQSSKSSASHTVTVNLLDYQLPTERVAASKLNRVRQACVALHQYQAPLGDVATILGTDGQQGLSLSQYAEVIRHSDHVGILTHDAWEHTTRADVAAISQRFEMASLQAEPDICALSRDMREYCLPRERNRYNSFGAPDVSLTEVDGQGKVLAVAVDCETGERITHDEVYLFDVSQDERIVRTGDLHVDVFAVAGGNYINVTKDGVTEDLHEPKGYGDYLLSPIKSRWRTAMVVEIENINSHSTVIEVRCDVVKAKGKKIYAIVWVFKVKRHSDGSLDKLKARACVVGSSMERGVDFWESYATGAKWMSIMCVLALCAVYGLNHDFHWDVSGAFLVPELDSEMYVQIPPGFQKYDVDGEPLCWQVIKGLYGAPPAMRLFKLDMRKKLLAGKFVPLASDDNVWMYKDETVGVILFALHVDEGIGAASSSAGVEYMLKVLRTSYGVDVRRWETFYGFGLSRDIINHTVSISAERQIADTIKRFWPTGMPSFEPKTPFGKNIADIKPISSKIKTDLTECLVGEEKSTAAGLTGKLTFVAKVRGDIKTATALTARRMSSPTQLSYSCDLYVLRYLSRSIKRLKTFGGGGRSSLLPTKVPQPMPMQGGEKDFRPHGFGDSNLEDPIIEPRSMSGMVLMLAGSSVHDSATKQQSIAIDITAAETFAQSSLAAISVLFKEILTELAYIFDELSEIVLEPIRLYCDNAATVLISQDATSARRVPYVMRSYYCLIIFPFFLTIIICH